MKLRKYGENEATVKESSALMKKLAVRLFKPGKHKYLEEKEQENTARIIGETLWVIFSHNHVVVNDKTQKAMVTGTWRYAGELVANVISKTYGIDGIDYLTFYCPSSSGDWVLEGVRELARMGYTVYCWEEVYVR
jgi:hypothetical protein